MHSTSWFTERSGGPIAGRRGARFRVCALGALFTFAAVFLLGVGAGPLGAQQDCSLKELVVGHAVGSRGATVQVDVVGGVNCVVTGFSMAVGHDPGQLRFVSATPGPFLTAHAGDQLAFRFNDERNDEGYAVVLAIFDLRAPLTIPPTEIERGTVLATMSYEILASAALGVSPLLNRTQTFGDAVPVSNIYSSTPGEPPIQPSLVDGSVTIEDGPPANSFRRGDPNEDATFDLSDVIFTLAYLFRGRTVLHCVKSADSNDDGDVDLSDAIYLLSYLFLGGDSPPLPFLACGVDPTPDLLSCESYGVCGPE